MPTAFETKMAAAMVKAKAIFGTVTFTYKSNPYQGVQLDDRESDALLLGGFSGEVDFILHVIKAELPSLPVTGDIITIATTAYRILSTVTSEGDPGVQLVCGSPEK